MNYLSQWLTFRQVQRALSYDADRLRQVQWRKLRGLVAHAYESIPFYRQQLDQAGVRPDDLRSLDDLSRLPVIRKADLQAAEPDSLISRRYRKEDLVREQTSGSSGRPFAMYFDTAYRLVRKALFMRALKSCGYRLGQRMLFVTSHHHRDKKVPAWTGWRYVSYKDAPEDNLRVLNEYRPRLVYGWVTPIRRMAQVARERGIAVHRPAAMVTTAETLDAPTRQLLEETFGCPVYEIYGLTETGTLAWRSPAWQGFRISHESLIVEFAPADDGGPARRLIVTNLALWTMPFIRYDTDDLAVPAQAAGNGQMPYLERVEGRLVDCVRLADGRVILPFQLTMAMEEVPGVVRYQIRQDDLGHFTIRYEAKVNGSSDQGPTVEAIRRVMRGVLGEAVEVEAKLEKSLDPPPGRKFRVVESCLGVGGGGR
ncbi:MAG TPA: hypothetical protein VF184_06785 [Phycisphaeraceae bacterium]